MYICTMFHDTFAFTVHSSLGEVAVQVFKMRLICFWCFLLAAVVRAQNNGFYAPQTYRPVDPYHRALFSPARNDVHAQSTTVVEPWRPAPVKEQWRDEQDRGSVLPKPEPWRLPYGLTKEQQAAILHHKQSLSSDGAFRFEYASDNGLAAGEQIEPDGSRVGAYQYKDPSGQLVKLKYRAGKDGFQILEGSHLPKSPEPVPPASGDQYYQQAYAQQRQQYTLQQQYNQQRPEPQQPWGQNQGPNVEQRPANNQYYGSNWRPQAAGEDDGQYRENEVDLNRPHSFGEGYAFAFKG
ncbi:uncharacterized protein LOC118278399 isoform X2 [Spodoptera frugiperda]|uniref:Uncharacterized protein LOC118278399 isoform X2 n=1 Tax=Spodoptera frugiperda TaxID=7108 RepID=A0A9R0F2R0_SPOFR|nr:uncharacterized protein LOC118278399 isoform X2 [Spodoptera frugiperda]